jgi:hypothetical protein
LLEQILFFLVTTINVYVPRLIHEKKINYLHGAISSDVSQLLRFHNTISANRMKYSTDFTIDLPITLALIADNASTKVKEIFLFFDR